jgi:hypothetical protein
VDVGREQLEVMTRAVGIDVEANGKLHYQIFPASVENVAEIRVQEVMSPIIERFQAPLDLFVAVVVPS